MRLFRSASANSSAARCQRRDCFNPPRRRSTATARLICRTRGTGHAHSIAEFCEVAFRVGGLDWKEFVDVDPLLLRKVDSHFTRADSSKLQSELGWRPRVDFTTLVDMMVQERIRILKLSLASTDAGR